MSDREDYEKERARRRRGEVIIDAKRWRKEVRQLIADRRKDPDAIHALPFCVDFTGFGHE